MKNLHLMSLDSKFNSYLLKEINDFSPHDINMFVWRGCNNFPFDADNAIIEPNWFSADYINQHHKEWDRIFLHELFLSDRQVLRLSDEAAKKITWVVWGHDLYRKPAKPKRNWRSVLKYLYSSMQQKSIFFSGYRKKLAAKVSLFQRIAIGFPYDEVYIRKKFGATVPVVYGPYFSRDTDRAHADALRELHSKQTHEGTNILIGHCGAKFIQHEKYLRKLAKYRNHPIHLFLIMSYLASPERIEKVEKLAGSLFSKDQYTIITELMPRNEYYEFLAKMDLAIFPFLHQAALGNTKRLAYMGVKLYLDPRGVLAKGFKAGGVGTFDCRKIGWISYEKLIQSGPLPDRNETLFDAFDYERNIHAWEQLLLSAHYSPVMLLNS